MNECSLYNIFTLLEWMKFEDEKFGFLDTKRTPPIFPVLLMMLLLWQINSVA